VGRAVLLQQLDAWLQQAESRLLLLTGAAGRGKTALLLHWMEAALARDRDTIFLYLPISIRFDTAGEAAGVQLLHAALCDVFGELRARLPQQPQLEDYIEGIRLAWERLAQQEASCFVLVVDGLDEAIHNWFVARPILPVQLPGNLHVVVAARHRLGDRAGASWLPELGGAGQAGQFVELDLLGRDAMAEVVAGLGGTDGPPVSEGFLEALYRLTDGGDPLLVTLWIGQVTSRSESASAPDMATLEKLRPSFAGFYEAWLAQQREIWAAHGLDIRQDEIEDILDVLAVACGPLRLSDLLSVLGFLGSDLAHEPPRLSGALESARRLVVGDEGGYALVHPRLGQHLQEHLQEVPDRLRAVQEAFRRWGADTVTRLNSGQLAPQGCPPYLVTHYVPVHVDTGNACAALDERYLPLLRAGWARAWYAHEVGWEGYLGDVSRIVQRLHAHNQACVAAGRHGDLLLAPLVRCALLLASIRSQTVQLPPKLVVALTRAGIWSLERAARAAAVHKDGQQQAACLLGLAAVALEAGEPPESWQQLAVDVIAALHPPRRFRPLIALAKQLPQDPALRERVLTLARAPLPGPAVGAQILLAAAAQLRDVQRLELLNEGLEAIRVAPDAPLFSRWDSLAQAIDLAAELTGQDRAGVLHLALGVVQASPDDLLSQRVPLFCKVACLLEGNFKDRVLQQAWQAATASPDGARVRALCTVADCLADEAKSTVLCEALEFARQRRDPGDRVRGLRLVAGYLTEEARSAVVQEVLAVAQLLQAISAITDEGDRAEALLTLAAHVEEQAGQCLPEGSAWREVQKRVLAAAAAMDNGSRAYYLGQLAAQARGDRTLLMQVLDEASLIRDAAMCSAALLTLAGLLEGNPRQSVLQQALDTTGAIREAASRADTLTTLASAIGQGEAVLQQAQVAAMQITAGPARVYALCKIVRQKQGPAGYAALRHALDETRALEYRVDRAEALCAVAGVWEDDRRLLVQEALTTASRFPSDIDLHVDNASAVRTGLCALAAQWAGELGWDLWQQAVEVARSIKKEGYRAVALCALASHAQGEARDTLRQEAWEAATHASESTTRYQLKHALTLEHLAGLASHDGAFMFQLLAAAGRMPHVQPVFLAAAEFRGDPRSPLLQQVRETARQMDAPEDRARLLCAVAVRLDGEHRRECQREAMQAVRAVGWNSERVVTAEERLHLDSKLRAPVLRELVTQLAGDSSQLRTRCLDEALGFSVRCSERISLTLKVARQNPSLVTYALWAGLLADMRFDRAGVLTGDLLSELVLSAIQLSGRTQEAEDIATAIHEACLCWS
jgi:hypothetical protein